MTALIPQQQNHPRFGWQRSQDSDDRILIHCLLAIAFGRNDEDVNSHRHPFGNRSLVVARNMLTLRKRISKRQAAYG